MKKYQFLVPLVTSIAVIAAGGVGSPAWGASTVDHSDLLTQMDVDDLATLLGAGDISLTQIFEKTTTNSFSTDWHAAVDNKGATFTVMEVTGGVNYDGTALSAPQIIGGYDPQSWNSSGRYNLSPDGGAFLFNLTDPNAKPLVEESEQPGTLPDEYQTYNDGNYGPAFGGGVDLLVDASLSSGYANRFSYGLGSYVSADSGPNILGFQGNSADNNISDTNGLKIGQLETFTWTPAAPVPEPAFYQMGALLGMGFLGAFRRRANALNKAFDRYRRAGC